MHLNVAESRHLEWQITYARPIVMVLAPAPGDLLEESPSGRGRLPIASGLADLGLALLPVFMKRVSRLNGWQWLLPVDAAKLQLFGFSCSWPFWPAFHGDSAVQLPWMAW